MLFSHSNGDLDPWTPGGVTYNLSDSLVAIMIEGAAHHLDLSHTHPADPMEVVQARQQEKRIIQKWIHEYNSRRNTYTIEHRNTRK